MAAPLGPDSTSTSSTIDTLNETTSSTYRRQIARPASSDNPTSAVDPALSASPTRTGNLSPSDSAAHNKYEDDTLTMEQSSQFWSRLLCGPLVSIIQGEVNGAGKTQLRSACLDCLSSMGAAAYCCLSTSQQMMCVTLLLGLIGAADEEEEESANNGNLPVQEAAIRAVGVFIMFPPLRSDSAYVADSCNLLIGRLTAPDCCPAIRAKAAWSLANASDALLLTVPDQVSVPNQVSANDSTPSVSK